MMGERREIGRFDIAAEQRRIEVERARPVRVELFGKLPGDNAGTFWAVKCGNCPTLLTLFDLDSGLISVDRWNITGWNWRVKAGRQRRQAKAFRQLHRSELTVRPEVTGPYWQGRQGPARFPVTKAHGWCRPDLPAVLRCPQCSMPASLTAESLLAPVRPGA
jgi:hypothetical protein